MKIKDLKISTQLKLGFAAMLFFVIILGVISYMQSKKIYHQTETIYEHPLQVRRAIGMLRADVLTIHRDMKDLFLTTDEAEIAADLNRIKISKANAFEKINILYDRYLGPRNDIDSFKQAFIIWDSIQEETVRLMRAGRLREAMNRTKIHGAGGAQTEVLFTALQKIDDFAMNKGEELIRSSRELNDSLKRQLFLLIAVIMLLSFLINYVFLRNIRTPLNELAGAAKRFHDGDMNARSLYTAKNEFGVLSESFNTLAEGIQIKRDVDERFANLASLMLSEYDAKKFFQFTLNALADHTGSQMAAIYLLSDDKRTFDHFESIGLDNNARQSFEADRFEGEFGAALSSRKVQHLKSIPEDTRFIFHTVSVKIVPREILTIPVIADNAVVAVISLASVSAYSKQSLQLIDNILVTLCARVEGIMGYHKMKEFSRILENQNSELEAQKNEMAAQSSELMKQNTELEMQKKQLDEASRLKTSFLSNMSHELRTPLNSVIALSGVLHRRLEKQIPQEEYSYLEVIERNGKHLLALINDILDISRIESGREEFEITKFNANTMISEIVGMIKPQALHKNIDLLHIDDDSDLSITSDADKFGHILQNLIGNAVKFTKDGKVEITSRQSKDTIAVTVADTGIGISEDHISRIFDEFRQADGSTSRRFGGTGLGLAIAKKYANLLGGSITVKSTPGKGSDFTLTLPLSYKPENRITENRAAPDFKNIANPLKSKATSGSASKTILLVEDSEPAIIQIRDFLEESGYRILVAADGGSALDIISHTIPDAMILDLKMPGIDGFDVLKSLRNAEPTAHIPVLILTAKHITKDELKFLKRNNVHQLIQKGDVNRDEFLDAVYRMVSPVVEVNEKPPRKLQKIEGKPLVLVVEDNPDNMTAVKALLDMDYTVIEAVDAAKGIELANLRKPDLILMDIALPEMDGIEAFKIIRKNENLIHIPVIALTANAMTRDRESILAHGFDGYIAKPIESHLFFKVISEVLYGK